MATPADNDKDRQMMANHNLYKNSGLQSPYDQGQVDEPSPNKTNVRTYSKENPMDKARERAELIKKKQQEAANAIRGKWAKDAAAIQESRQQVANNIRQANLAAAAAAGFSQNKGAAKVTTPGGKPNPDQVTDPSMGQVGDIPPFVEGSERTPLSAQEMNRIVYAVNRLNRIQGANGIQITYGDGNVVISLRKEDESPAVEEPVSTSGTPVSGSTTTNNYTCICRWT